eukprot:EG_transcript_23719
MQLLLRKETTILPVRWRSTSTGGVRLQTGVRPPDWYSLGVDQDSSEKFLKGCPPEDTLFTAPADATEGIELPCFKKNSKTPIAFDRANQNLRKYVKSIFFLPSAFNHHLFPGLQDVQP